MVMMAEKKTNAERCKEYYSAHREDRLVKQKAYYDANREIVRKRNNNYHKEHRDEQNKKQREYSNARYPTIREKHLDYYKEHNQIPAVKTRIKELNHQRYVDNREEHLAHDIAYNKAHKSKIAEYNAERGLRIKNEVLTHYGNGKCVCVKCGFDKIGALSIDHINGGGTKHREEVGSGLKFYKWLKDNSYPDGYASLCMNCQFLKAIEQKELSRKRNVYKDE